MGEILKTATNENKGKSTFHQILMKVQEQMKFLGNLKNFQKLNLQIWYSEEKSRTFKKNA